MEGLYAHTHTWKVVHNTLGKKSINLLTDTHLWVAVFLLPILSCTSPPLSSKTRPGSQHLPSPTSNTTDRPSRVLRPTYWDKRLTLDIDLAKYSKQCIKTINTPCGQSQLLWPIYGDKILKPNVDRAEYSNQATELIKCEPIVSRAVT